MANFRGFPSDLVRVTKFSVDSDWPAGKSNISRATMVAKASSRCQAMRSEIVMESRGGKIEKNLP